MTADVREAIRTEALARGFDAVGFAAAHLAEEARADLAEFLARGYHGQMDWLAAHAARRGDPQTLWADARTVVVLGLNYGSESDDAPDGDCGIVSVYARGRDYHDTIKKRLKALARWIAERWPGELKVFVDTGKTAGATSGDRLAGQAHQPRFARFRVVAIPGRNLSEPGARTGCR
jgi:epoxyqueuosine reductase